MEESTEASSEQAARRVYGVLATSLNEALAEVRQALAPHESLLPAGRLADYDRLLEEFARRRVRIAIYGEVKAGKSTLINAIAGAELSPAAFDPLTSVPVRVTYGPVTSWRVGDRTFASVDELASAMRERAEVAQVDAETNLDLLQLGGQVDLLDTPGVGSEERFDEISAAALAALDAAVLVVRYPALFTQFTRRLMNGLESDIGKLFVVWNLDADCADLSPEERARHAETLRQNVAGAHELYLVDARAGLRAARDRDQRALEASGLAAFSDALARFASSDKRAVTALREAAKRAHVWLDEAERALTERRDELDTALQAAGRRLDEVERKAGAETRAAEERFAELRAALARIGTEYETRAAKNAAALIRQLRAARRRWIRSGDIAALEEALAASTTTYADAALDSSREAAGEIAAEVERFGARFSPSPRRRSAPSASPLAPEDRELRATQGSFRMIRRSFFRRWYLPGLVRLERDLIAADTAAQKTWFETNARAAEDAARAVLDERLAAIRSRADGEAADIKTETEFDARQAEFEALNRHLPIVSARRDAVEDMNRQARDLLA
jgi:signal recognition particle receptor subunit beta